ncbi:hypothetical protein SAMN05216483_0109 [Streptomyces sp. 2131.1]|uniref:hypothetical protein n=1 Tax=Streptomyces sp. 2131.1 TaxID=1855346 RepID=UPI00089AE5E6|nr:hypothetical protein [Streptomyces sp. 2131.1]SEB64740.1 hypothetical protein SAMN05216483_0109 [Streptomyces sp. 2131.1]
MMEVSLRHFNQTGWTAIFNSTDTETGRTVRVEGWDQVAGTALVVDPMRGALRAVTDYEDFSHWSEPTRSWPRYLVEGGRSTGQTKAPEERR